MLVLKGKIVTLYSFVSKKTGKEYLKVGVAGEGEYNQVSGEKDAFGPVKEFQDVEYKVSAAPNGQLWLIG